jgi:tetratricopeptide (TPR) repeat protein
MGQYRWRDGTVELFTAWSDGPTSSEPVGYESWIETCLADIRDTGYVHVARKATRALDEGDLDRANKLFRDFEIYARLRPGAYNRGALGRIIATAALAKAARNGAGADTLVATALAASLLVEETEEKGTAALGRRLKKVLGSRYGGVLGRAVAASLGSMEADWGALDETARWRQLLALRERVERLAGAVGLAALAEAAAARETEDRNLARFAQVLASKTGQSELLGEVSERLAGLDGASIADLNNQANALMQQGEYRDAEAILRAVAARLSADPGSERQALIDEYFYRGNLAELLWRQERYQDGLEHAERAYQLERTIADLHAHRSPFADQPVFDKTAMFSNATWAIISTYTRLGRIDDAERIFEGELADENRLAARHEANAEAIENAFNAGMCIYTENKSPSSMERGRRLFDLLRERVPVPSSRILTWCYACAYGYYGDEDKAREFLERAIAMGVSRPELRNDPDFDPVRDRPWFRELVG